MAAPGCVSEAVEMECGRSEIDELIKEVSGAACPGHGGRAAPPECPAQAVTPARMGREGLASPACQCLHLIFRPLSRGLGPSCLCASTESPHPQPWLNTCQVLNISGGTIYHLAFFRQAAVGGKKIIISFPCCCGLGS